MVRGSFEPAFAAMIAGRGSASESWLLVRRWPLAVRRGSLGWLNGVAGRKALGAQMGALVGAQFGRALSHRVLKEPAARLEAGLASAVRDLGQDRSGSLR
jgi:hypothetical protein